MTSSDATLDRAALEALFRRLERPMHNVVLRSVWSEQESQDVVQEAFVRLWDMRERVELDTVEALVWRIALNLASKRRRWARLRRFFGLQEAPADARPSTDEALARDQEERRVRAAVDALPDPLRDVVMLTAFSGMSYEEVGQVLRIPPGTVGSRRNKALGLLRARLVEVDRD